MEVDLNIIELIMKRAEAEGYSHELPPIKRVEIAGKILQKELLNESEVFIEFRRKQEETDTRSNSDFNAIWSRSLDMLGLQVELSREANNVALNCTVQTKTLIAISRIHGRGCHIGSEIYHLLRGGYPDGAEARWRTLYELDVIASFLCGAGDDVAERYLDYEAVEMYKFYRFAKEHYENLKMDFEPEEAKDYNNTKTKLITTKKDVDNFCNLFGPCFKNNYGWAADVLCKGEPNFADIEMQTEYIDSRIHYKIANFSVHGGPRAAFYRRGLPHPDFVLMGPSRYGLKDPINNTAHSLVNLTRFLSMQSRDDDKIVTICDFQYALEDEILKASNDAEIALGPFEP